MIQSYLKTGMVVYDDRDKQHFRSACCKEKFFHYTDKNHFPSFQFFTDMPISIDNISIFIYDLDDNLIGTFDEADFNVVNTIYHGTAGYTYSHNNVDIISYPDGVDYETGYYLKICHEDPEFLFAAIGDFCIYVIDNLGNLTLRGHHDPGCGTADVWGKGKFAFVAAGGCGLHSYYINPYGIPTHLDDDDQGGSAHGVWGDGSFIYLANGTRGLESYSADADGALTWISNDDQGGSARSVWGDGDYIYLANSARGLESYSVDGGGNLTHVANDAQASADANGVWGDGNFIYVADANRGIDSYSVDGAGALTWISTHNPGTPGADVWGDGNFIYLASYTGGIDSYSVDAGGNLTHIDDDDRGDCQFGYGVGTNNNFVFLANDTSACADQRGILVYSVDGAGNFTYVSYANSNSAVDASQAVFWKESEVGLHSCWYSEAFKVCDCDVEGVGDGENLIENGDFEDWFTGANYWDNYPLEWTLDGEDDDNYVVDAGGGCQIISDNLNTIHISQTPLTVGEWYVFTCDITAIPNPGFSLQNNGAIVQTFLTGGLWNIVFQAAATDIELRRSGVCDVTFTNVRVEKLVGFKFCDMMTLNWWADCDWDSIIYQYGYRNSLVLGDAQEKISLDTPSEDIVVNPTERLGEMFVKDVVIKKRYMFKIRIPEYLWNALIRLAAYGSEMPNFHCWITLPDGSVCPMSEVNVLGEWDTGNCMNTFIVEFVDNDEYPVVATNCCKDEDVSEV